MVLEATSQVVVFRLLVCFTGRNISLHTSEKKKECAMWEKTAPRFPLVRSLLEKNPTTNTFKAQGDDNICVGAPQKSVKVHLVAKLA